MVIDFHTHIFPDAIAAKTIAHLASLADIKAYTDGTLSGLKASMQYAGIDYSVVLPVVTKPSQFESINTFAATINNKEGILSFGGIHPDNDAVPEKIAYIKALGLRGIKLHPDYQNVYIDDIRYLTIMEEALRQGLIVSIHSGIDVGLPTPVHCTPVRISKVIEYLNGKGVSTSHLVFAHTGACMMWEEVEQTLVGKDIYLDLSYSFGMIESDLLLHIIRKHGANRILFATDSPWGGQKEALTVFSSLSLTRKEQEEILYQNACSLLDIS